MKQYGRTSLWLLLALAVAGGVGGSAAYWYVHPEAVPWWARDFMPVRQQDASILYKWRDAAGNWQYGDQPPQGRDYEEVEVRHDTNVVPHNASRE